MNIAEQLQTEMKVYVETDMPEATHIKYEVYYALGGMNYFNSNVERRGYYLSVVPVQRSEREYMDGRSYFTESFGMFRGTKKFLNNEELKRVSTKALKEARSNINDELINELTKYVKYQGEKNGFRTN